MPEDIIIVSTNAHYLCPLHLKPEGVTILVVPYLFHLKLKGITLMPKGITIIHATNLQSVFITLTAGHNFRVQRHNHRPITDVH